MTRLIFLFLFLHSLMNVYGQKQSEPIIDSLYLSEKLSNIYDQFFLESNYKGCRQSAQELLALIDKNELGEKYPIIVSKCLMFIGSTFRDEKLYDTAMVYYRKALTIMDESGNNFHREKADIYTHMGNFYNQQYNLKAVMAVSDSAISILQNPTTEKEYEYLSDAYSQKLYAYLYAGEFEKAEEYGLLEWDVNENLNDDHQYKTAVCFHLAMVYEGKGDLKTSIKYVRKALDRVLKKGESNKYTSGAYLHLANNYLDMGDPAIALNYLFKLLQIAPNPQFKIQAYQSIATAYNNLNDYNNQLIYLNKALEIFNKNYGFPHPFRFSIQNDITTVLCNLNNCDKGLALSTDVIKNIKEYKGSLPAYLKAETYANRGFIYFNTERLDSAAVYLNKALDILSSDETIHKVQYLDYSLWLSYVYTKKGELEKARQYQKKGFDYHPNTNYYNPRFDLFKNLIKIIYLSEVYKKNQTESDKQTLIALLEETIKLEKEVRIKLQDNRSVSEHMLRNNQLYNGLLEAYNRNPNKIEKRKLFEIVESHKGFKTFADIKNNKALDFSEIPDEIVDQEYKLRTDIVYYEKKLNELEPEASSETNEKVFAINDKLVQSKLKYDELIQKLESNYPDYYKLKYDLSTVSLDYVQNSLLSPDQTLLEYFVGDSSIFIFTIQKDAYEVTKVKKDFPLEEWVKQLNRGIDGYYGISEADRTDQLYQESILQYTKAGQQLYDKLLKPIKSQLRTKDLIIIPDGVLGYVPFGALLSAKPKRATIFKSYPYLEKDYNISYCYSATLLREMKEKKHRQQPQKTLLAMAPFYEGSYEKLDSTFSVVFDTLANGQDTVFFTAGVNRQEFNPLPGSGQEVYACCELWQGDCLLNADATEEQFNQHAGDYRIVHLSTHGIADHRVGDYSYLAFSEIPDSIENELLYVRDLYNLKLNADLVVLSACETGIGELQKGEGIISLARAFAYAGAKSMVTTLWVADDAATPQLMKKFHIQLKSGKKKDEALQAAKLKLMDKGNQQAHPFFWAGFVPVGDMSALD